MADPLQVLLIEDSEDDALLIAHALQRGGFAPIVERVQTAQTLVAALAKQPWDVIIADYHLPMFDAPSALELLKQSGHDIPFLITSGTVGEQAAVAMMRAGAHDYVMKDNLDRLPEAVRREIREAHGRAERRHAESALQSLFEGTASVTGIDFFQALVQQIGISLNVTHVLVSELIGTTLHSLAYWAESSLQTNMHYPIPHTPCEIVLREGRYVCASNLQQQFPHDIDLQEMQAESYLGVALRDMSGRTTGNLCILDTGPISALERTEAILQVFANRAAAELERQRATLALQQVNQELETIVGQRTAELRNTNEQLLATNMALGYATRQKDQFLANMSHELRTPLNAILGLSESLQEQIYGTLTREQHKAIVTIEQSGKHLLHLINDILDLSKIASGALKLNKESVDLMYICENSILFVKEQALRKQIQLISRIPTHAQNLMIVVDELRIRQALINLLANAVKFTPDGGCVWLDLSLTYPQLAANESGEGQADALLLFSVIDTGIGIAADDMKQLFQPFVQIDSQLNRQREGTGLGLALVKQIAELHDGTIDVESQVGIGSRFTLTLPCTPAHSALDLPTHVDSAASIAPPLGSVTTEPLILIAEDNELNIGTFSDYLIVKGFRLLVAKNGFEAIRLAKAHIPDLILMDVQMPGMDGIEAMQIIRADAAIAHIPIIALTALAMPDDEAHCLAAGASGYMAKPVRLKQLVETINHLLVH